MKKASSVLIWTLFILMAFRQVGTLIASCFGYSFELISMPAYTVAIAVLSVCTFAFDIAAKDKEKEAEGDETFSEEGSKISASR